MLMVTIIIIILIMDPVRTIPQLKVVETFHQFSK